MFERKIELAKKHVVLINFTHFIGGFGLAILLQYYISGNAFLPVALGWILMAFTVIGHVYVLSQ